MANMSYCRFRNTRSDLGDCLEALNEKEELSRDEARAAKRMFKDMLNFCEEHDIIANYDEDAIESMIDRLIEADEE